MKEWRFLDLSALKDGKDAIRIMEMNGPAGIASEVSNITHATSDQPKFPYNEYPCVLPAKGQSYSYIKTNYIEVFDWALLSEMAGGFTELEDFCIFATSQGPKGPCSLVCSEWGLGSHEGGVIIGQRDDGECGMPHDQYVPAKGVLGITGESLADHPYYRDQTVSFRKIDCFSAMNPCIIDRTVQLAEFTTKAYVTQLVIPAACHPGQKPVIEFHFGALVR